MVVISRPKSADTEHDSDVGGDHGFVNALASVQEGRQIRSSGYLLAWSLLDQVGGVGVSDLGEAHRRHHGGIADGLELHVAAIIGALELDDDEAAGFVEGEEVDAPASVLPVAELLGDDEQIVVEGGDVVSEQALEVSTLVHSEGGERSRWTPLEPLVGDLEKRHCRLLDEEGPREPVVAAERGPRRGVRPIADLYPVPTLPASRSGSGIRQRDS